MFKEFAHSIKQASRYLVARVSRAACNTVMSRCNTSGHAFESCAVLLVLKQDPNPTVLNFHSLAVSIMKTQLEIMVTQYPVIPRLSFKTDLCYNKL